MIESVIQEYYKAFNDKHIDGMLAQLNDDIVHDINEGEGEKGKELFKKFLQRMNVHYDETLKNIAIMVSKDGKHAAAEFVVHGKYLKTDPGLPVAHGQKYEIPAGAFFDIKNNKISRVTMYYNLKNWIAAVDV